eukprot:TRINITY_DN4838_c0_g1_i6.p2 TRINITY_DN4838_c0_g1~~TRINITY_DN4838_c0_g1_i6.p2  ORF type:complete len:102 (-),score=37.16 TRINITY_DN4838_c0_g1_i6:216-521(-)
MKTRDIGFQASSEEERTYWIEAVVRAVRQIAAAQVKKIEAAEAEAAAKAAAEAAAAEQAIQEDFNIELRLKYERWGEELLWVCTASLEQLLKRSPQQNRQG